MQRFTYKILINGHKILNSDQKKKKTKLCTPNLNLGAQNTYLLPQNTNFEKIFFYEVCYFFQSVHFGALNNCFSKTSISTLKMLVFLEHMFGDYVCSF